MRCTVVPAGIRILPPAPVTFSDTCAVMLRPAESRRELIESSSAAWISVPIGRVRRLASANAPLGEAAPPVWLVRGAVSAGGEVVSRFIVSGPLADATSGRAVAAATVSRRDSTVSGARAAAPVSGRTGSALAVSAGDGARGLALSALVGARVGAGWAESAGWTAPVSPCSASVVTESTR